MVWRFSIQHPSINGGSWLVVPEPIGWDEAEITLARDPDYHGIDVEYSLPVKFVGDIATLLYELVDGTGIDEVVLVRVEHSCKPNDAAGENTFATVFEGRMNLGDGRLNYEDGLCLFDVNLEQDGNIQTLRSRLETQINLLDLETLDGSAMAAYTNAPKVIELLGQTLILRNLQAHQGSPQTYPGLGSFIGSSTFNYTQHLAEPTYVIQLDEIGGAQPTGAGDQYDFDSDSGTPTGSQSDIGPCFRAASADTYELRVKATISFTMITGNTNVYPTLRYKVDSGSDWSGSGGAGTVLWSGTNENLTGLESFVWEIDEELDVVMGALDYLFIAISLIGPGGESLQMGIGDFGGLTHDDFVIDIRLNSQSEKTDAKVCVINEALSRLAESITDNKVTAQSNLFGQPDSEPLPNPYLLDGDAFNLSISNGLLVRQINSQEDNNGNSTDTPLSYSLQDLLEALNACYNIGYTLEDAADEPTGATLPAELAAVEQILRIEPKRYFYKPYPVAISLAAIREFELRAIEKESYTLIKGGFEKSEVENLNGLYEFNTKREFTSNIKFHKSSHDIRCKMIGSGYIIEKVRRISPDDNASTDTSFDTDLIFVSLARTAGTHPDTETYTRLGSSERAEAFSSITADGEGNILDGNNRYNLRISPHRNLIRWLPLLFAGKSIAEIKQTYFEGNDTESWELTDGTLNPDPDAFTREYDDTLVDAWDELEPYYQAFELSFKCPLSWQQYLTLKAQRYNPIQVTDSGPANGYWYLREVNYEPATGMAKWRLVKANGDCVGVLPTLVATQQSPPLELNPAGASDTQVATFQITDRSCCTEPVRIKYNGALPLLISDISPQAEGAIADFTVSVTAETTAEDDTDYNDITLELEYCGTVQEVLMQVRVLAIPFDFDNAVDFDGVNDYLNVPDHASLNPGTGDFSINLWFKKTGARTNTEAIFYKRQTVSGKTKGYGIAWNASLSALVFVLWDNPGGVQYSAGIPFASITNGVWYMITAVRSGTNIMIYLNGSLVATTPTGAAHDTTTTNPLNLGRDPLLGILHADMELDEVTHFDKAINGTEIGYLYNSGGGKAPSVPLQAHLAARWPLDSWTGSLPNPVFNDVSANSNLATGQNFATDPLVTH